MRTHLRDFPASPRQRAIDARDVGLALVGRANRWMISGAVVLAAGLSALTAHAFHLHAATMQGASSAGSQRTPSGRQAGDEGAGTTPLESPAQAPAAASPTPASAPAVSGGS